VLKKVQQEQSSKSFSKKMFGSVSEMGRCTNIRFVPSKVNARHPKGPFWVIYISAGLMGQGWFIRLASKHALDGPKPPGWLG